MFTSTTQQHSNDFFFFFHDPCGYVLLRRSAVLQCAPGQELYDLSIGAILVDIRNREDKASPHRLLSGYFSGISSVGREECTSDQGPPRKRIGLKAAKSLSLTMLTLSCCTLLSTLGVDVPGV